MNAFVIDDSVAKHHAIDQFGPQTLAIEALSCIELGKGWLSRQNWRHAGQAECLDIVGKGRQKARQVSAIVGAELQFGALQWRHLRHFLISLGLLGMDDCTNIVQADDVLDNGCPDSGCNCISVLQ